MTQQPATLALADGSLFTGVSIGVSGQALGEVVFNTAMTGYQEILTDPSYARQIVTLTYPHIGNTGTNTEDMEADAVFATGLVIRDLPAVYSNWRAQQSLTAFLRERKVVAIAGVDTRRLTRLLREKGAQNGCIASGGKSRRINKREVVRAAQSFAGLKGMDLAQDVSTKRSYQWDQGSWQLGHGFDSSPAKRFRVVAYDFGIKRNILRMLTDRGCSVTVVPAKTDASKVLALKPDGVFLSNGPGDPEPCTYAIDSIAKLVHQEVPIFGICLGHQLLALAAGARTLKMKFGHHGANHPVLDLDTGRVLITSQNHGFVVDGAHLPPTLKVTHRSLFDDSIQGLAHTTKPAFSFQGHPEASPGPQDIHIVFDRFIALMEKQPQVSRNKMQGGEERIAGNS